MGLGSVGCDGEVAGLSSSQNGEGNGADELVVETLHSFLDTLNRAKDSIGKVTRFVMEPRRSAQREEMIEVVVKRMESEEFVHKKGDLWLLLDSITQLTAKECENKGG